MWTTEHSIATTASPEAVWEILRDVNGWGAWNAGIEMIELDEPLAVGATFRMKPSGEDVLTSAIAELEENRRLTDVTDLGDLVVRVAHLLAPTDDGGTTITYRVEVDGAAADAVGEEVGQAVSADFPEVLAALAAAAASTPVR